MKNKYYLIKVFESNYCKITFILSLIGIYFLIPNKAFEGYHLFLSIILIITSSIVVTCLIRNIKERVIATKEAGGSIISILLTVLGLTAVQTCGVGAPVCGATIGTGVLSLILPGAAESFFTKYATHIIILTIILQITSLYFMKCFKHINEQLKGKPCNNKTILLKK